MGSRKTREPGTRSRHCSSQCARRREPHLGPQDPGASVCVTPANRPCVSSLKPDRDGCLLHKQRGGACGSTRGDDRQRSDATRDVAPTDDTSPPVHVHLLPRADRPATSPGRREGPARTDVSLQSHLRVYGGDGVLPGVGEHGALHVRVLHFHHEAPRDPGAFLNPGTRLKVLVLCGGRGERSSSDLPLLSATRCAS